MKLLRNGPAVASCIDCGAVQDFELVHWEPTRSANGQAIALFPLCSECLLKRLNVGSTPYSDHRAEH